MEDEVVKTTTVSHDPVTDSTATSTRISRSGSLGDFFVSKTNQVIFTVVGIISLLILFRFIFLLLGANQVGIVSFILAFTEIFVAPARGIFPSPAVAGSYFDAASLVAIVMWLVLGLIVIWIVSLFSRHTPEETT